MIKEIIALFKETPRDTNTQEEYESISSRKLQIRSALEVLLNSNISNAVEEAAMVCISDAMTVQEGVAHYVAEQTRLVTELCELPSVEMTCRDGEKDHNDPQEDSPTCLSLLAMIQSICSTDHFIANIPLNSTFVQGMTYLTKQSLAWRDYEVFGALISHHQIHSDHITPLLMLFQSTQTVAERDMMLLTYSKQIQDHMNLMSPWYPEDIQSSLRKARRATDLRVLYANLLWYSPQEYEAKFSHRVEMAMENHPVFRGTKQTEGYQKILKVVMNELLHKASNSSKISSLSSALTSNRTVSLRHIHHHVMIAEEFACLSWDITNHLHYPWIDYAMFEKAQSDCIFPEGRQAYIGESGFTVAEYLF